MKIQHSLNLKIIKGALLRTLFLLPLAVGSTFGWAQNDTPDNDENNQYVNPNPETENEAHKKFRVGFDISVYGGWLDARAAPSAEAGQVFSAASPELTAGVQSQIVGLIALHPKWALRPFTGIQIMDSRLEYSRVGFNSKQHVPVLQSAATLGAKVMYGNFNELRGPCISVGGSLLFNVNPEQTDRVNTPSAVPMFDLSAGWPVKMGNSQVLIEAFYGISTRSIIESSTVHEQWWARVTLHKIGLRLALF